MTRFLRKYRWHLVALLVLYTAISLALYLLTDAPQTVPFDYQVN